MWYNRPVDGILAVIPAFEPDERLVRLVRQLLPELPRILVVDDGSVRAASVFKTLREISGVRCLRHGQNRGKGAALKTAFAEVLNSYPDATGVVTADADGQHLPDDIIRVALSLSENPNRLTLGVRTFDKDIPFRSKLGNLWTVAEFRLLTRRSLGDTQSGLRGIPRTFLPELASLPGERYDYEIRMLVKAARSPNGIIQLPIASVYEPGNGTSHFRTLVDTLSTQWALFSSALKADCAGSCRRRSWGVRP